MNFPFLALLAEVTELELMDGITLMVVGMGVVFFALLTLWALLGVIGFRKAEQPKPALASPTAAPAAPVAVSPADDTITPEVYAIITAAVIAVAGRRARIQRVRFVRQADESWAIHGRQAIQASHRIRKG